MLFTSKSKEEELSGQIHTSKNELPQSQGPRADQETFKSFRSRFPRACVDLWIVLGGTAVDGQLWFSKNDRILLTRRNILPYKGELYIPGGSLVKGETLQQAVSRKMKAELGLEKFNQPSSFNKVVEHEPGPFHIYQNYYPDSEEGVSGHDVVMVFCILIEEQDLTKISLDEDNAEWRAIPIAELAAPDSAYHPNVVACARAFMAQFRPV